MQFVPPPGFGAKPPAANSFAPPPGGGGPGFGAAFSPAATSFVPPPTAGAKRPASQAFEPPPGAKRPAPQGFEQPAAHAAWGGAGSWPMAAAPMDSSLQNIRDQIKQLQRSDPTGKEQWVAYCDTYGGGKHDPGKHDENFISSFLGQYASGARLDTTGNDSAIQMVTKMLQRKSPNLKEVWAQYCNMHGGGKSDPMKHDADFHVSFYDQVCATVTGGSLGNVQSFGGGPSFGTGQSFGNGPSFGSGMSFGNGPSFGNIPSPGGLDPEKATLVNRIKAYQKADLMQKEAWETFCNTLGDSTHTKNPTKDPNRHDVGNLQMFIQQYGVP